MNREENNESVRSRRYVNSNSNTDDKQHNAVVTESWHKRLLRWLITVPMEPDDKFTTTSNTTTTTTKTHHKVRNYEVWTSERQFFFLGGRFRSLKSSPTPLFTFIAMLVPGILFAIFDASWCWHHIHPSCVILFYYSWLQCIVSFVKAASYDPGFIPRNVHLTEDPFNLPEEYFNVISLPLSGNKDTRSVDIRYCHTCRDWRMPRSFHCSKCDQCVSIHDHHCKWLSNCVGERNYRFFFTFLSFAVISCSFICGMCYYRIFKTSDELNDIPMTLFNVIYGHLASLYPFLLLVYHTYLCSQNQTTREYLKTFGTPQKRTNPFDMNNVLKNFVYALCKPRGSSYLQPRAIYEEGDLRFVRHNNNTPPA